MTEPLKLFPLGSRQLVGLRVFLVTFLSSALYMDCPRAPPFVSGPRLQGCCHPQRLVAAHPLWSSHVHRILL